jgi:hypothetical protein
MKSGEWELHVDNDCTPIVMNYTQAFGRYEMCEFMMMIMACQLLPC